MKFKVGDRVRVRTKTFAGHPLKGYIGTVICVYTNDLSVGVEFDERFDIGHNCEGLGKNGHCRYGNEDELEYAECEASFEFSEDEVLEIIKGRK